MSCLNGLKRRGDQGSQVKKRYWNIVSVFFKKLSLYNARILLTQILFWIEMLWLIE